MPKEFRSPNAKRLATAQVLRVRISWLRASLVIHHSDFGFQSNLRFPALPIFATPQFVGFLVANDVAAPGVEVERVAGAPGDVAEVTPKRAPHAFFNFRI